MPKLLSNEDLSNLERAALEVVGGEKTYREAAAKYGVSLGSLRNYIKTDGQIGRGIGKAISYLKKAKKILIEELNDEQKNDIRLILMRKGLLTDLIHYLIHM